MVRMKETANLPINEVIGRLTDSERRLLKAVGENGKVHIDGVIVNPISMLLLHQRYDLFVGFSKDEDWQGKWVQLNDRGRAVYEGLTVS
jgi:hypothetical protein